MTTNNTTTKHTLGRWSIRSTSAGGRHPDGSYRSFTRYHVGAEAADGLNWTDELRPTANHVCELAEKRTPEEAEANAHLIAAAPALLAALEDAEFLLRKVGINWKESAAMADSMKRSAEDARAAIALAIPEAA